VYGSYKSYKSIFIEKAAIIFGDIFAEGDIKIDDDCIVMGNVFSQSRVFIGNNVHISKPGTIKSIIGKKFVELGKNTVIYGYVLSEGEGIVK